MADTLASNPSVLTDMKVQVLPRAPMDITLEQIKYIWLVVTSIGYVFGLISLPVIAYLMEKNKI